MTASSEVPKPPRSLKSRGRALWREVVATLDFDAPELELLVEICRTLDQIDALSRAIEADGTMVVGSQGQPVLHPAVAELRQQQAAYARLSASLNLEAIDVAAGGAVAIINGASRSAKAAADKRWGPLRRANGGN